MAPKPSLPHEPCHFFILQYGRSKESYQEYFYHPSGCDFPTFQEHVTTSVREFAQGLVAGEQDLGRKPSDFDLVMGGIQRLDAMGFVPIKPTRTLVVADQYPDQVNQSGQFFEWGLYHEPDQTQAKSVMLLIYFDGIYMDNLQLHLFEDSSPRPITPEEVGLVAKNNLKITELIEQATPIKNVYEVVSSEHWGSETLMEVVFNWIQELGFDYLPSHDLFWPCSHRLAPEMEEILGQDTYRALMELNQERDADAPLHNPDRIQPNEDPFGDQEDLPF